MTDREIIDEILRVFMEDDDFDIYLRELDKTSSQMNKLPDIISNINIITIETMGKYFFIAQSIHQIERLMSYDDTQYLMEDDDFDISLRKQSVTVE